MERLSKELAEEFARELIAEIRPTIQEGLNEFNWRLVEAVLVLQLQDMPIEEVLNSDRLGQLAQTTINEAILAYREQDINKALDKLLDQDCIELVVTTEGKLSYRWKV